MPRNRRLGRHGDGAVLVSDKNPAAILLVDHGSRRAEANDQLEEIAKLLRARQPGRIVKTAHLELATPTIAEGVAACVAAGAQEIIVHPYMLTPGRHSTTDIPDLAKEAAAKHPGTAIKSTEPLGVHEKLVDLIQQRITEATSTP